MCDCCGHRFYPPWTAIKGNTVSLILWPLNAVWYPPYVAACVRTCSDTRRSAADASAGPPGKYPSGRTWCPHRWRGPLQQQQKRKGKKIVKINFTSHTFKADLGELQFLSFFGFFIIFYFYVWQFQVRLLMAPCAHILAKKSCELWQVLPCLLSQTVSTEISRMQTAAGNFIPSFGNVKRLLRRAAVNVCSGSRKQQQQIICLVRFA